MKKPKFKHLTRHEVSEKSVGISMTRPESVQPLEVLLKHRATNVAVPYFNGVFTNQDTPDIFKMDFTDIAELRDTTAEGIEAAKEDLHALNKRYEELRQIEAQKAHEEAEKAKKSEDSDSVHKTP